MAARPLVDRVVRSVIVVAAVVLLVASAVVVGALVYLTTERGEQEFQRLAINAVGAAGLGRLEVDGLDIGFPLTLRAEHVSVIDGDRRWLDIRSLRLQLTMAALVAGNLRFALLAADELEIGTMPDLSSDDDEPSTWPHAVIVKELSIKRMLVAGELIAMTPPNVGPFTLRAGGVYRLQSKFYDIDAELGFAEVANQADTEAVWAVGPGVLKLDVVGRGAAARGSVTLDAERIVSGQNQLTDVHLDARIKPAAASGSTLVLQGEGAPGELPEALAFLFGPRFVLRGRAELGGDGPLLRSATADIDAGAGVTAHADVRTDPADAQHLLGRLTLNGAGLAWPAPNRRIIDMLGDRFAFMSEVAVQTGHNIALSKMDLRFGPLAARGEAGLVIGDLSFTANLAGSFDDLALLSGLLGRPMTGAAEHAIAVSGVRDALVLTMKVKTVSLSVEGSELDAVAAAIDVTGLPDGPVGADITATFEGGGEEFELDASIKPDSAGALDVVVAVRDLDGGRLNASGRLRGDGGLPIGRVSADITSLSRYGHLLGVELAGRIEGALASDGRSISGTADASALLIPGGVELQTLSLRSVPGSGSSASSISTTRAVAAEVVGLRYGGLELDTATIALRRVDAGWIADVSLHDAQGAIDVDAVVEAETRDDPGGPDQGIDARLTQLRGSAGGHPLTLIKPFALTRRSEGGSQLTGTFGVGQGDLAVDWSFLGDASFGEIHADQFPLRYITPFVDDTLWLDGEVAADIVVHAPDRADREDPSIKIAVRGARTADVSGKNGFAGFDLDAQARQRQSQIVFTAALAGDDGHRLVLEGTVARRGSPATLGGVDAASALSATLRGGLGPRAIAELAALADLRLHGELSADLSAGGTVGDPTLKGVAELARGRYEDAASGAMLENISLRVAGRNGANADITLSADDGEKGRLEGSGRVDSTGGILDPRATATVNLKGLRAARLDEINARVSGSLEFYGARDALRLSGRLRTDELAVELPKRLPVEIHELTVVEENTELLDRPTRDRLESTPAAVVELDVVVDVPGPAFVRSREVKTEWRGRVTIGGTSAAASYGGGLDLMRGDFAALGVRVVATEGKLRFDPSPEARHSIELRGHIRRDAVDVTVIISGLLTDLSVRLQSEPPMPEDEILSFVLFGSSVSTLTPLQGLQLAAAVASLANSSSAADPVAWFRKQSRLDRVEIVEKEFADESQYMLSAGKYVRQGVFVSVEQPLGQGASEVSVELDITSGLTVKSSVGADSTGSVGVGWTHDY